jgi:hypothetical protein
MHKTRIGCTYVLISPFVKNKSVSCTDSIYWYTYMYWKASMYEAWNRLKLWNDRRKKALYIASQRNGVITIRRFKHLICTGRIAERTGSCYMLLLLESIFFPCITAAPHRTAFISSYKHKHLEDPHRIYFPVETCRKPAPHHFYYEIERAKRT